LDPEERQRPYPTAASPSERVSCGVVDEDGYLAIHHEPKLVDALRIGTHPLLRSFARE
jgi:hypothetical protein